MNSQGRQRLLWRSVRFTWTGAGKARQCCKLKGGRGLLQSLKDGSVHSWSVLACSMRYHKALKLAQAAFAESGADGCWIFEDDVSLPNSLSLQQAAPRSYAWYAGICKMMARDEVPHCRRHDVGGQEDRWPGQQGRWRACFKERVQAEGRRACRLGFRV